jgi:hypothetical protein
MVRGYNGRGASQVDCLTVGAWGSFRIGRTSTAGFDHFGQLPRHRGAIVMELFVLFCATRGVKLLLSNGKCREQMALRPSTI